MFVKNAYLSQNGMSIKFLCKKLWFLLLNCYSLPNCLNKEWRFLNMTIFRHKTCVFISYGSKWNYEYQSFVFFCRNKQSICRGFYLRLCRFLCKSKLMAKTNHSVRFNFYHLGHPFPSQCEKERSENICCQDSLLRGIKDWACGLSVASPKWKSMPTAIAAGRVKRRKTCLLQGCVNNIHIIERNGRPNCFPIAFGIYLNGATYAVERSPASVEAAFLQIINKEMDIRARENYCPSGRCCCCCCWKI